MSDKIVGNLSDTSEELYVRIARLLRADHVQPGDALPSEASLCVALGIGRQQVREGLRVLEAFGAVVGRQGARRVWRGYDPGAVMTRGAALLSASEDTARDLLIVRHALETSLLPTAAMRLGVDELRRLRSLADEMVSLARAGQSFAEPDEQYHRALFAPLRNAVLDGILQSFWSTFDAVRPAQGSVVEDPGIAAMHGRIIDAIDSGDTRLAVHELDAHFYGVRNRFPDLSWVT